jgi:uncharacterized protein (DUF697 family)
MTEEEYRRATEGLVRKTPVPVLWLFGKTGSGKSSIIRVLTGQKGIEIGSGFRPQTRFSSQYVFPDESEPLLRFLDTRGLGEVAYDPQEDIEHLGDQAQLMIVVVRALDHALDEIVSALREIRKAAPRRPVILALTALHDAYPGRQHPAQDPFGQGPFPLPDSLDDNLRRSIALQYERFKGLFDRAVPIDFTQDEDGFENPSFGAPRLKTAIVESLPAAYRQTLLQLEEIVTPLKDLTRRQAMPVILAISTLSATAAAVPVPWIDIPIVMALQTQLAYKLARIYRQPIDARTIAQVTGALGGRIALRMAIREGLKFIPWIGMATNAAAAFAYTFAGGMAWNRYFTRTRAGHVPTEEELKSVFQEQLQRASDLWKATHSDPAQTAGLPLPSEPLSSPETPSENVQRPPNSN